MLLTHYHHHPWFLHDLNLLGIASWLVLTWVYMLFPLFYYIEDNVEIKCGGGDYFWLLHGLVRSNFGWLHLDYVFCFKNERILKNFELLLHFYTCYPWTWPIFKKEFSQCSFSWILMLELVLMKWVAIYFKS